MHGIGTSSGPHGRSTLRPKLYPLSSYRENTILCGSGFWPELLKFILVFEFDLTLRLILTAQEIRHLDWHE
jgi:hypothetical protein